mmetsp:Transcript_18884/g.37957  ORF Transcript_18884/g.37957 Transcript_18884/m.37957 type:complete len:214 (-) Transcript_18884:371-1012(-)
MNRQGSVEQLIFTIQMHLGNGLKFGLTGLVIGTTTSEVGVHASSQSNGSQMPRRACGLRPPHARDTPHGQRPRFDFIGQCEFGHLGDLSVMRSNGACQHGWIAIGPALREMIQATPIPIPRSSAKENGEIVGLSRFGVSVGEGPQDPFRYALTDKARNRHGITGLYQTDGVFGCDDLLFDASGNLVSHGKRTDRNVTKTSRRARMRVTTNNGT